jgi:hypothetical protein
LNYLQSLRDYFPAYPIAGNYGDALAGKVLLVFLLVFLLVHGKKLTQGEADEYLRG